MALALGVAVLAVPIFHAGTASGGSIAVQASFGGCEPSGQTYACRIDASFTGVSGADYYTASVTGPDGVQQDFGTVRAGSASVWARYSADGAYTIQISAWDDGRRVKQGTASAGG